ncbi:MAG: hypothetical protein Q9166_006940 [cf. Caloplaca sp. 2 TL-2023]
MHMLSLRTIYAFMLVLICGVRSTTYLSVCRLSQILILIGVLQRYQRPDLEALPLVVYVDRLAKDDHDLLFLTPYVSDDEGPFIYNLGGELIWDGHEYSATGERMRAHNLHVVEYGGVMQLAYTAAEEKEHHFQFTNIIMNGSYAVVERMQNSSNDTKLDPHDFDLIDNGTRILEAATIDLPPSVSPARGSIKEAVLQVVNIETRNIDFEWRSLDHVPVSESCLGLDRPDYFHINSATRDAHGNFIISGYHICEVLKISGFDSSILWRLGGSQSDFHMLDGYEMKYVHHVRIQQLAEIRLPSSLQGKVSEKTHLALSMFDNAFATVGPPTAASSSAIVVLLDLEAMTGQVVERYTHPRKEYAAMFGSVQFLPNGDRFVGWGSTRQISQHTQDGEVVYHAELGDNSAVIGSLRAFKAPWSARPLTDPDLYSYSWTCGWKTTMYASWNGATDVKSWRFFKGKSASGPWTLAVTVPKSGFETMAQNSCFARYIYAEALGAKGTVLGRSRSVKTRVPRPIFSRGCSELRCPDTLEWDDDSDSCDDGEKNFLIVQGQAKLGQANGQ